MVFLVGQQAGIDNSGDPCHHKKSNTSSVFVDAVFFGMMRIAGDNSGGGPRPVIVLIFEDSQKKTHFLSLASFQEPKYKNPIFHFWGISGRGSPESVLQVQTIDKDDSGPGWP